MPDSLRALLARLPALDLNRAQLHAWLYRQCDWRVPDLWDLVREPAWERLLAQQTARILPRLERQDWAAQILPRPLWPSEEHALVWAAAALRALDLREGNMLSGQRVVLPNETGGQTTLFLRAPEHPLDALVPDERRLRRSPEDLRNDLRSILSLEWNLVLLDRHAVQPDLLPLPSRISKLLRARLSRNKNLRIGIASPFADLDYVIRADPARAHAAKGIPYRFAEIEPACLDAARAILEQIVADCAQERIDLLCFPELTLDTSLRRELCLFLKTRNEAHHPALVMAGSFHLDTEGGWANRCHLLDGLGDELFTQEKCTAYRLPGEDVEAMSDAMKARMGLDGRGGYEDITLSHSLLLIEGALGRLATPICLDFCGDLRELLIATQANFFAVPAMTPRMDDFKNRARELGTYNRAMTLVVNSAWLVRGLGLPTPLSFLYLPAQRALQENGTRISDHLSLFTIRELLDLP